MHKTYISGILYLVCMTDYAHILIKRKTKKLLYANFRAHETWDTFLQRIFDEAMKYEAGCMPNGLATVEGLNTSKSGAQRLEVREQQ